MNKNSFFNKIEVTDYDDLVTKFRGAELDFKIIGYGNLKSEFLQFGNENFVVTFSKFNQKFDQAGLAYPDKFAFVIPAVQNLNYSWRRYEINDGLMPIFKKNYEFETISPIGFSVFTIAYPDNVIENILKRYGAVKNNFPFSQDVYSIKPSNLYTASDYLHSVTKRINTNPAFINSDLINYYLLTLVPFEIMNGLGFERNIERQYSRSIEALHKVRSYVRFNPTSNLDLTALSKITAVTPRSLQIAFRDEIGLSPKKYTKIIKLNEIRRELQNPRNGHQNISDIANKYGFWHMGQFAKDYREMFGELPSDTLRNK